MSKRVELGCPGHFIGVSSCRYRRHTQVGKFRVSTVGDYFPESLGIRTTLGFGQKDWFETMVFETRAMPDGNNDGCGCRAVKSMNSVEMKRYATAGAAQEGHERMVAKYARKK